MKKFATMTMIPIFLLAGIVFSSPAWATHFRFGNLSWEPTGTPGQVIFHLTDAFRRNGYSGTAPDGHPKTGDIILETIGATFFFFGDGSSSTGTLRFKVTAFSVTENWIIGEALNPGTNNPGILHTYSGAGPFIAGIDSCCRLSTLNNRADGFYRLETIVRPLSGNRSPVSTLVPIVIVPQGSAASFIVPGADPDGNPIRFRFATSAELGGGPNPPGLSINSTTGQVTWNNIGLNQTNFWTTQVVIEDLDANGNVKSKTPVDFLLKIVPQVGSPPSCAMSPAGPLTVTVGSLVSLTVTGTDPDSGDAVTLNTGGLPSGATASPALPVTGPSGVSTTINWTPTAAQARSHVIIFSATDSAGQQSLCSITINVITNQPPTIICPPPVIAECTSPAGATVPLTAHVEDPDGDALTVTWEVNGVPEQVDIVLRGGPPTSADVTFARTYSLGVHTVTVTVDDGQAAPVSCSTTVTVVDTTPPAVSCSVALSLLWPPNHNLVNVGLSASVSDACDPRPTVSVFVLGDEDDEEETGDGNFSPDAKNIGLGTLQLRGERKGNADGRVYLIVVTATDASGNMGFDCCTVVVPHSLTQASLDSVLAQAAAAKAFCLTFGIAPPGYFVVGDGPIIGSKQ